MSRRSDIPAATTANGYDEFVRSFRRELEAENKSPNTIDTRHAEVLDSLIGGIWRSFG